jgi:hypothetical protein
LKWVSVCLRKCTSSTRRTSSLSLSPYTGEWPYPVCCKHTWREPWHLLEMLI